MKTRLKSLPYYPLLFAISPVLSLYAQNTSQVTLQDAGLSLGLVLVIAVVVYSLALAIARDDRRAALVALVFVVLFFLYGTISQGLRALVPTWVFPDDDRRYLLPVWGLIFIVYSAYALKTPRGLTGVTRFLNASSSALALVLVANIVYGYAKQGWLYADVTREQITTEQAQTTAEPSKYPDIYYIILDGYARQDILANYYDYDNSAFIEELESMGFYVAKEARANYCQTALSLASSLNMEHIADIFEDEAGTLNRSSLQARVRANAVTQKLREHGYRIIAFDTGLAETSIPDADVVIPAYGTRSHSKPFTMLILDHTPLRAVFSSSGDTLFDLHRQQINAIFDRLGRLQSDDMPQFVFAHIVSPHPPFVFGPNGEPTRPEMPFTFIDGSALVRSGRLTVEEYRTGYLQQLIYINTRVLGSVRAILQHSETPPVIILQSDHGPGSRWATVSAPQTNVGERMSILSAYLLPAGSKDLLYQSITPVNSFRIVLSEQFDAEYSLVHDTSYYSPWTRPFELSDVTQRAITEAQLGNTQ